jgi:hypothetical protein
MPITFDVVEGLGYDCIIGITFLEATKAVIDLGSNAVSFFDGLVSVPMTRCTGIARTVFTITNVILPPYSESVFSVSTLKQPPPGDYIIEGNLNAQCRTLLVARALVNAKCKRMPCRVLNPTDKPITLLAHTPVAELTSVTIAPVSVIDNQTMDNLPSIDVMRAALEAKQISLTDTAVTGHDLDKLITLLYKNLDLVATSLNDLPGTDIMLHRIDTGSSAPIRTRGYRHSPADNAEISRQVHEMREAGVIEESDTAWGLL